MPKLKLEQIGNIYARTEEEMKNLEALLEKAGYRIAYDSPVGGAITKEVEHLESENQNS